MNPPDLAAAERRRLKGLAQRLAPVVFVGKSGLTEAVTAQLEAALARHGLVKARFVEHKEERHELAEALAGATGSALVTVIGHTAVFFRPPPAAEP